MKNKTCRLLGIMAAMILVSGQVWAAQIISKVEDASVAMRVKNGYSSGTLTMVIASSGSTITGIVNGIDFTITVTGANTNGTITLLADSIGALTNAAGTASLTANKEPSLDADSTDAELLDGTYTAAPGEWLELLWDTSTHLSLDLYFPSRTYQTGVSAYILDKVQALPTGTGNVTASIYKGGTLIAQKVIVSPVYVPSSGSAATNNYVVDAVANLSWELDMPFTGKDAVIVRAARGTTLTAGVIVATIPNR